MREKLNRTGIFGLFCMIMFVLLLCALPGYAEEEDGCVYEIAPHLWYLDEPGLEDRLLPAATLECYYLMVDDQVLVASECREDLSELFWQTAEQYVIEYTVSCELVEDGRVKLCYGKVNADASTDLDAALETLDEVLMFDTVERERSETGIPFEQETVYDDTIYEDVDPAVTTPGEDGVLEMIAHTTFRNGILQKVNVDSTVIQEPVTEITTVGTKERPEYVWPVRGRLSSRFGPRNIVGGSRNHKGIDIAVPTGTAIHAARAGKVIYAGWSGGYGNLVQIRHEDGDVTYYGHNSALKVSVGDWVAQGETIALAGSTGQSTGPHCHFEIRINGTPVNPLPYVNHD